MVVGCAYAKMIIKARADDSVDASADARVMRVRYTRVDALLHSFKEERVLKLSANASAKDECGCEMWMHVTM